MNFYDILFAKKLAGGGGGGGGNAETATIVISVSNGTPTITSGAFPEWCTTANKDYIYGKAICSDYFGEYPLETGLANMLNPGGEYGDILRFYGLYMQGEDEMDEALVIILTPFSMVSGSTGSPVESGTYTINLIYMPN